MFVLYPKRHPKSGLYKQNLRVLTMTSTQAGEAGASLLRAALMITSRGALEVYNPVADDDHRDLAVGLRGKAPMAYLQVKTTYGLDARGNVRVKAKIRAGSVPEHPSFLYAVLLVTGISLETCWLIPSPDFNRLVYKEPDATGSFDYEFVANPLRSGPFSPYQMQPAGLGPRLVAVLQRLTEPAPQLGPPTEPPPARRRGEEL
jgi:hypothetical protein